MFNYESRDQWILVRLFGATNAYFLCLYSFPLIILKCIYEGWGEEVRGQLQESVVSFYLVLRQNLSGCFCHAAYSRLAILRLSQILLSLSPAWSQECQEDRYALPHPSFSVGPGD